MPNGQCFHMPKAKGKPNEELSMKNRSNNETCQYLLQCVLSRGAEKKYPC